MQGRSYVPNLETALNGPLRDIEKRFLDNPVVIETWFRSQWAKTRPPLYGSVDLRNSGNKLAPVDTNLFPAGFNNLSPELTPLCIQAVQATIAEICPDVTRLLLVPESHSRNVFYFESLHRLYKILCRAGFSVKIGSVDPELTSTRTVSLPSGNHLEIAPIIRNGNKIGIKDFSPCAIILNNDLSQGVPDSLQNLEQSVLPSTHLGWSNRLKSKHFEYYQNVCNEFALVVDCDPWLFNPLFEKCPEVDFMKREGQECLYTRAQQLLHKIKYKYEEYNIEKDPFLVIKADAGTYGMAVMMIKKPEEILQLNRKQRTRMSTIKGGKTVTKAIIQEGVYTLETVGESKSVAEPVVYTIGRHVVGGFYRVHKNKAADENLNAPGMNFKPLAFAQSCQATSSKKTNRFYSYGVVARLALLAASREIASFQQKG